MYQVQDTQQSQRGVSDESHFVIGEMYGVLDERIQVSVVQFAFANVNSKSTSRGIVLSVGPWTSWEERPQILVRVSEGYTVGLQP